LVAVAAWVAVAAPGSARASSYPKPRNYTVPLPEVKSVFVMLAPLPPTWTWQEYEELRRDPVGRAYPKSGLYREGSDKPVWTIDWYAHESQLHVSPDGRHLVRAGIEARRPAEEALSIYADGRRIRTYDVRDLVELPELAGQSRASFDAGVIWRDEERFDGKALTYTVVTRDGGRWVFDVKTGAVLQRPPAPTSPPPTPAWRAAAAWAAAAAAVGALLFGLWLYRRQKVLGKEVGAKKATP
jgi:hypothetical protein